MLYNSVWRVNQRAYISAPLRFLASTIISCKSTETSSERTMKRGEKEREIRRKSEEIIEIKATTDRHEDRLRHEYQLQQLKKAFVISGSLE